MTRKEFFEQRAKADFLKTHGVTKVPPAPSADEGLTAHRIRHGKLRTNVGLIVRRMSEPAQNPITSRPGTSCSPRVNWEPEDKGDAFERGRSK